MSQAFDDKKYRSPWNPDDERPEGPIQVDLTSDEATALVAVVGQSWSDAAMSRFRGSPETVPVDLEWMDDFRRDVVRKIGEGINGFDERSARYLINTLTQEATLLGIAEPTGLLVGINPDYLHSAIRKLQIAIGDVPTI